MEALVGNQCPWFERLVADIALDTIVIVFFFPVVFFAPFRFCFFDKRAW